MVWGTIVECDPDRYRLLSELSALFHWSVCPSFMPISHCLINVTLCKVWNKEVQRLPTSSSFFKIVFGYSGSPAVSLWILDWLYHFCKKAIGIFEKIAAWNLHCFGKYRHFNIKSSNTGEYRISFHLLRPYLISFPTFCSYQCTSLSLFS